MDTDDLLLAGDDSSWNMSDWQWDANAFVAVPKLEQQSTSDCCKRQKTVDMLGPDRQSRPCGGCKAIEHEPLKYLQPAGDSAGSNSCDGRSEVKHEDLVPTTSQPASSNSAGDQPVVAAHASGESSCQADGCMCDLTKQSVWHQKSRICDVHMSGMFFKQGKLQQFCQQCGRSHNLDAFDKGRRSCRTQLAKHAARRRKKSAAHTSTDAPSTAAQGKVAGTIAATGCRAAVSIAALALQDNSSDAWFQTLCNSQKAAENQSLAQPLDAGHRHSSGSSEQSQTKSRPFALDIQPVPLAELDSGPLYRQPPLPVGLNPPKPFLDGAVSPAHQLTTASAWTGGSAQAAQQVSDDPLQDVLDWQLPRSQDTTPQLSSFDLAMAFMSDNTGPCNGGTGYAPYHQQQQQQLVLQPEQLTPAPGYDAIAFPSWNAATVPSALAGYNQASSQAAPAQSGSLLQQAYTASNTAVRLSIKLFNCTPAQLPSSLRERVTGWLGSTPPGLEGYIRPGCLHLTVQATLPQQPEGAAPCTPPGACVRAALTHLLASPQQEVWHKCTMLVQLGNQAAVVHQGVPLKVWNIQAQASDAHQPHQHQRQLQQQQQQKQAQHEGSSKQQPGCCGAAPGLPSKLPVLVHAQPVCLVAGDSGEQRVPLLCQGIPGDCKVLCRAGGKHLEVQLLHSDEVSDVGADVLQVVVPGGLSVGLLYLEVQRGSFMGPALPVLIAPSAALAAEVVCMLHKTNPADRQGLIVDLGCAMQHAEASQLHRASEPAASSPAGPSVLYTYMPLIARATQAGLVALVRHLMGAVAPADLEAVAAYRVQGGMGLLHLGVQSGKLDILAAVLEASSAECWQGGLAGPGGVTPFHLAVLLPDAQPMALLLAATFGASHWFCSPTHDGHTPADFAVRCGKEHLNHAIGVSMWSQASAGECICQTGKHDDTKQQLCGTGLDSKPVVEQMRSLSTGGWSDSSSSADDDSVSDVDASQHSGKKMFTMPEAVCALTQGLSAAADFVHSRREGLAAVLRQASWFKYDPTK